MPRRQKLAVITSKEDWPLIQNEPSLKDWLTKHKAMLVWKHDGAKDSKGIPQYLVACFWIAGARSAIVVVRPYQQGWDIFTAGNNTNIDRTLADAESRLGI